MLRPLKSLPSKNSNPKNVILCRAKNVALDTALSVAPDPEKIVLAAAARNGEKKIAKAAARLTYAFANADVPKVTVVVGKANGTAGLTMNSKSIGSDIVYAWKNAKIGVMEAAPAVKIMYADEIAKADNAAALINEKAAQYNEMQASALAAAKRGYVDDIIEASETRQRVVAAFEMLFTKREDRPSKKHGTI